MILVGVARRLLRFKSGIFQVAQGPGEGEGAEEIGVDRQNGTGGVAAFAQDAVALEAETFLLFWRKRRNG